MVVVPGTLERPPEWTRGSSCPRLLLVDRPRQRLFLAALRTLLSSPPLNAEVVVTTQSSDAVKIAQQRPFDLVLCDVRSEPLGGPELCAILAERCPNVRVILLADREDESLLVDAFQSGAAGFFTKDTPVEEFLEGVNAVHNGHFTVGRHLLRQALARLAGQGTAARPDEVKRLSPSELGILSMVGQAQPIRTIAEQRGISQKTVRNHLASIYRKIGVCNRTEAVLWTARTGLMLSDHHP